MKLFLFLIKKTEGFIFFSYRLKDHLQTNNDPRIRQLLMETLMRSGSNEEILQQFIPNYP